LLRFDGNRWTLEAAFDGNLQITGIAVESPNTVWLSTSDGIRRLDRSGNQWKLSEFRIYYQGHPGFVSGGYIPGEDAVRLWGYVDKIYIPPKLRAYSPMAVSTEHGWFTWGGYGVVWHHYMPHYSGANSAWLDLRELIPHRRPTCVTEDAQGNLWVGTEYDGLVRLNAKGREDHKRDSQHNQLDGSEFSHFNSDLVGWGFERVENMSPGPERGVWCILSNKDRKRAIARWEHDKWEVFPWPEKIASPATIRELSAGKLWIGIGDEPSEVEAGIAEMPWDTKTIRRLDGPEHKVREIVVTPSGQIFAASWWSLYQTWQPDSR
jgi:hypothetical protein